MKLLKWRLVLALIFVSLILVGCGGDDKPSDTTSDDQEKVEMGDPVPEFGIMTPLSEENQVTYEAVSAMVDVWKDLGMDARHDPTDFNALSDRLRADAQDFDGFALGWSGRIDRIDPDMFIYAIFHSSNTDPGGNNYAGFNNEAYDALAEAQRTEMDPEKRQELVFEAQEMLADEAPINVLYVRELVYAYNHDRFDNFVMMAGEGIFNEWTPMQVEPLTDDKVLRIATSQDLSTLNPLSASTVYEWQNLRLIYDKLVRLSPEAEPQPAAATSWDVIDDTTVDVTLREGMTFHDGEPVTVEDVKFTYDYMIEHEIGYFIAFLNPIDSVETPDDSTIRFNLKEPYAPFINVTLAQIPILPKHIWENLLEEEGFSHPEEFANEEAIGSGPFVFEGWRRGEDLITSTNKDFYEDIAIDGYILDIYAQDDAVMTALELGEADVNSVQFIPASIEKSQQIEHLTVAQVPDIGFNYFGLNGRRAPFHDKAFRQAIAHTIDFDTILEVYLDGYGLKGGAGMVINEANEFWHNSNIDYPEYDPEKAREILAEAGYTWDDNGKLHMPVGMEDPE